MSIFALAFMAVTGANAFHETFARAETAYGAQRYAEAATAYEQLVGEQVHEPAVFYNLGNAYLRLGEIGLAIANYERALQLAPGMVEAQTNLALAVRGAERQVPRPRGPEWEQALLFWHTNLTPNAARSLALAAWLAFWVLLATRQWRPFPYARTLIAVGVVVVAATSASAWVKSNPLPLAVVIEPSLPVRHGTGEEAGLRFHLHHGDRVVIEEVRPGWVRVRLTDSAGETNRGWTRAEGVIRVGPPYSPAPREILDRLVRDGAPEPG